MKIFFGGFPVARIGKKNDVKKKKGACSRLGYCPFYTWSRYSALYRDIGRAADTHGQARTQPRHGRMRPRHGMVRPRYSLRHGRMRPRHGVVGPLYSLRHGWPALGECGSVHAHGLARGSRDTKHCIVAEGRLWVAIQRAKAAIRRNNAPRYDVGGCDMARSVREVGACVAIQFCIVTEGSCDTTLQLARARSDTVGHACDTAERGPRYGRCTPATRPGQACDTALCSWLGRSAHGLGVVHAQLGFSVCILCT